MKSVLRLKHPEFAEFYMALCDAIYCDETGTRSASPGIYHTSSEARRKARVIVDRMAEEGYLEYR